jgi:hypothetical protein
MMEAQMGCAKWAISAAGGPNRIEGLGAANAVPVFSRPYSKFIRN